MTATTIINGPKQRVGAVVLTGLITLGALSACTINLPGNGGMGGNNMMNNNDSGTKTTTEFGTVDIMFAQMMIPHHEQAIEMSTLAETRTTNPEVLALAKQIKAAQTPEIAQMTGWLAASGSSEMGADHDMGQMGMLDDTQMTSLAAAKGAAFDTLYLEGMIQHHLGAIDMAQLILSSGNPEVKTLGENVVSTQQAEIDQMRKLLGQ